jgi:hypothetical protein
VVVTATIDIENLDMMTNAAFLRRQGEFMQEAANSKHAAQIKLDDKLGWRPTPGYSDGKSDHINAQGLRSTKEYPDAPGPDVLRIAVFGDSFVYGNEVATKQAWPSIIESLHPTLEVLNYGVSAYGTDQAYLRYITEGSDLAPDIVVMGFFLDDLVRLVNVYRGFLSRNEWPLPKPRYRLGEDGRVEFVPNPLPPDVFRQFASDPSRLLELGPLDHWYRRFEFENPIYDFSAIVRLITQLSYRFYERHLDPDRPILRPRPWPVEKRTRWTLNRQSEAYVLQLHIFESFVREARTRGALPIIVFLPSRGELRATLKYASRPIYAPLVKDTRKLDVLTLDCTDAFTNSGKNVDPDGFFEEQGHYSSKGNGVVARWLSQRFLEIAGADGTSIPE